MMRRSRWDLRSVRDNYGFPMLRTSAISPPRWKKRSEDSQALLVESNHDVDMLREGPYPDSLKQRVGSRLGHLSNEALAVYLEQRLPMSVRHLFLAHISRTNNHESLALSTCREALERRGDPVPMVHLTYHDRPTHLLRLRDPRRAEVSSRQRVLAF